MPVIDAAEYAQFVAALPRQLEPDLILSDAMSTAFFKARQRGWQADALAYEANRQLSTNGGVGGVIARLRMLATQTPLTRGDGPQRPEWVPFARAPWQPTPFAWVQERIALLRRIGEGGFTPDAAENEMKALIAKQNASRDVDPFL